VRERVLSDGSVRTAMREDDVRAACKLFLAEGVETVAISFVWSVLHPDHERRVGEIVREMMPGVILTLGSQLYPQVREYTRSSTAVVNAYLAPIMKRYVAAVDAYFQSQGATQPVRYYQSNGGLAIGQAMTDRSVYAINSGPASAPTAGQYVCAPFGKTNVITVDMGGTSFDITLTKDGSTNINKNIDFLRYRIGVPMIQVETLGAGGGSIGWIDETGLMQVGPQSAGSDPGPACYGQGGTLPTVSDANLVLGYLNPDGLVGGRGDGGAYHRLGLRHGHCNHRAAQACVGAVCLWPDHLGREIQLHGHRPLVAGQRRRLRPHRHLFNEIEAQGLAHLKTDGFAKKDTAIKRSLDMRYVGQVHECTVEIGTFKVDARSIEKIRQAFHARHKQLYTYAEPHSTVEVVNLESTVYGLVEKPKRMVIGKGKPAARAIKARRDAVFLPDGKRISTPIYDGALLGAGAKITDPAIIEEVTTTVVIQPGWVARLDASGSYVITRTGKAGR